MHWLFKIYYSRLVAILQLLSKKRALTQALMLNFKISGPMLSSRHW
jgi:hypothetical protein